MDTQLRKGILDVCVLAAIRNEDSYGYKIIKDLNSILELSESTLYTILKRLEENNMLTVKSTIYAGRTRKYYHITEIGLNRIEEFKNDAQEFVKVYSFIMKGKEQ
jgi:PadR family transcriptional regulator PadR